MKKFLFLILILLPTVVLVAQDVKDDSLIKAATPGSFEDILSRAATAVVKEDFQTAKTLYTQAVALRPSDPAAIRMLYNVVNTIKSMEEIRLHNLDLKRKADINILLNLAQNEVMQRNYDSAKVHYAQVLALKPVRSQEDFVRQKLRVIDYAIESSNKSTVKSAATVNSVSAGSTTAQNNVNSSPLSHPVNQNARKEAKPETQQVQQKQPEIKSQNDDSKKKAQESERLARERERVRLIQERETARLAQERETARLAQDKEARRIAQENETKRIAQEKETARLAQDKEARRIAQENETKRLAQEKETARLAQDREARRIAQENETKRLAQEKETARLAQDKEARRIAQENETKRLAQEMETARLAQDREARRIAQENETKRLAQEKETARLAQDKEARRVAQENETKRLAQEKETARLAQDKEASRIAQENETKRLAQEKETARLAQENETKRLAQENENKRIAANASAGMSVPDNDIAKKEKFDSLIERAIKAMNASDWSNALTLYNEVLALNPTPVQQRAIYNEIIAIKRSMDKVKPKPAVTGASKTGTAVNNGQLSKENSISKPLSKQGEASLVEGGNKKTIPTQNTAPGSTINNTVNAASANESTDETLLVDNTKENVEFSKKVMAQSAYLDLTDSNNDIKLTCQGITSNGKNTFLKFLVQNSNPDAEFTIGALKMTYIQNNGNFKKLNPRYISPGVTSSKKEFPIVVVTESQPAIAPDEVFVFEVEDQLKKTKLTLNISGDKFLSKAL
jgi:hypothetical protein